MTTMTDILITLILVSLVAIGFSGFMGDIAVNYNVNTTNITYFSTTNRTIDLVKNMTEKIQPKQITGTWVDLPMEVLTGGYDALMLLFETPKLVSDLIEGTAEEIGIPSWFTYGIFAIFLVILIFAIMKALFKVDL